MKKRLLIIAGLVFLLVVSSGCKEEPQSLRICVDIVFPNVPNAAVEHFESFMEDVSIVYGNGQDIEVEMLPCVEERREEAIRQIQWEIENGGGPDIFIISNSSCVSIGETGLFPFPEQAMEEGTFLTLDKYIEKSWFMEWDKQTKVIMDAGRTEKGQQIIPMSYTIPVTCFREADVSKEAIHADNWTDMLKPDNKLLQSSAIWLRTQRMFYPLWEDDYLEYTLGELADYSSGELLFTEDELLQRIKDILVLSQIEKNGTYVELPQHLQTCINVGYDDWAVYNDVTVEGEIPVREPLTMVPIYSDDGGTTATVMSYIAINANTRQPENAFLYLDFLMSEMMQQTSDLYNCMLENVGVPVQENLIYDGVDLQSGLGMWQMRAENYVEFLRVVDQVTHVRFRNSLERQLHSLFQVCYQTNKNGEDIEALVSLAYAQMEATVGE